MRIASNYVFGLLTRHSLSVALSINQARASSGPNQIDSVALRSHRDSFKLLAITQ
jgi:hypothetical protein